MSAAGCASDGSNQDVAVVSTTAPSNLGVEATSSVATQTTNPAATNQPDTPRLEPDPNTAPKPDWLGSRVLPTTPDGVVVAQTTPAELADRQLVTEDTLPPPPSDIFVGEIELVDDATAERSTWNPNCPVTLDELRYLRLSFWGFDGLAHQGEMIVHADWAEQIVGVFAKLHKAQFPMEEMRVVTDADVSALPTGDGNNTSAFVCRAVTGGSSFSQHAYGLAIDINPFHNPYHRNDLVLPELSTSYLDRDDVKAGMVSEGDVVHQAFAEIGWAWGGDWNSLKDYQHFSANGK